MVGTEHRAELAHPVGALVTGAVAGVIFVQMFQISTSKWQIDDVLGVWALHGLSGLWGGIACGIFGLTAFGGLGGTIQRAELLTDSFSSLQSQRWVINNGDSATTSIAGGLIYETKFTTYELVAGWIYDSRNRALFADRYGLARMVAEYAAPS